MKLQKLLLVAGTISLVAAQSDSFIPSELFSWVMADKRIPNSYEDGFTPKLILLSGIYQRKTSPLNNEKEIQKAEELLDWVFEQMKSFLNETDFDLLGFGNRVGSLRGTLAELAFLTDGSTKITLDILDQLGFVSRMLDLMINCSIKLQIFNKKKDAGLRLLCKVLELNVRAIALYNSSGGPNLKMPGFKERVLLLLRSIYYWDMNFRNLELVSTDVKLIFEDLIQLAEIMVEFLAKYVHLFENDGPKL